MNILLYFIRIKFEKLFPGSSFTCHSDYIHSPAKKILQQSTVAASRHSANRGRSALTNCTVPENRVETIPSTSGSLQSFPLAVEECLMLHNCEGEHQPISVHEGLFVWCPEANRVCRPDRLATSLHQPSRMSQLLQWPMFARIHMIEK